MVTEGTGNAGCSDNMAEHVNPPDPGGQDQMSPVLGGGLGQKPGSLTWSMADQGFSFS